MFLEEFPCVQMFVTLHLAILLSKDTKFSYTLRTLHTICKQLFQFKPSIDLFYPFRFILFHIDRASLSYHICSNRRALSVTWNQRNFILRNLACHICLTPFPFYIFLFLLLFLPAGPYISGTPALRFSFGFSVCRCPARNSLPSLAFCRNFSSVHLLPALQMSGVGLVSHCTFTLHDSTHIQTRTFVSSSSLFLTIITSFFALSHSSLF